MPFSRYTRFKARLLALALAGSAALAAENPTVPKGSSREQMLRQLGEPRSQIVAGDRIIVFYARERYVLRNDIVIDFEPISAEPVRRPPPAPVAPPPVVDPAAATAGAAAAAPEPREPAPPTVALAGRRGAEPTSAAPAAGSAAVPVPAVRPSAPAAADPGVAAPIAAAEQRLEIKRVLPRNAPPSPVPPVARPAAPAGSDTPPPAPAAATATKPGGPAAVSAAASRPVAAAAETAPVAPAPLPAATVATPAAVEPEPDPAQEAAASAAADEKKAKVRKAVQRRIEAIGDAPPPDPTSAIWSGRNFAIAFLIVAGGIGYMVWRRRQHEIEMAATSVSRTPFEAPPVPEAVAGAVFSTEQIGKLERRRFEELVVAYYCKTGVVAARAEEAPGSPVHVKISWKGEKRPFACVHCIAQPSGLVDAKPLQQLFDVISAEGIRRGYVVTAGRFHVSARDFAEEKHLTILHGDLFVEKLNALPGPARNEIMAAISGPAPADPPTA